MISNLSELHEKTHFKSIGKNSEICALFLLRLGCWKLSVVYKSRVNKSSVTSCELLAIFSRSTWSRWAKDWGNLVWNQIIYLNQDSHWNSLASEQLYISRIKRIFFCMLEPTTIPLKLRITGIAIQALFCLRLHKNVWRLSCLLWHFMTFINKNNNNKKKERDKQTNTFQVSSICFQILLAVVCVLYGRRQRLSKHSCLTQMERAEKDTARKWQRKTSPNITCVAGGLRCCLGAERKMKGLSFFSLPSKPQTASTAG